jgi:hypothetical protein
MVAFGVFLFATVLDLLNPGRPVGLQLYTSLGGAAVLVSQALTASRILRRIGEDHSVRVSSTISAVLTAFAPIYLQWKINVLATRLAEASADRGDRLDGAA